MTQPPYPPSGDDPMSRFALFATALIITVAIGSQPRHGGGPNKSMCVCIPTSGGINPEVGDCENAGAVHGAIYRYPVTFDVGPTSIYKLCFPTDCANVNIAQGACLMTLATKLLREYDEKGPFW